MPIWTPLFGWMAAFVGGLEVARVIHPYAGVAFVIASVFQFVHWLGDMIFRSDEKGWWRPSTLTRYMRWEDEPAVEGGKYNPGQKLFFWAVCLGAVGFLVSGIPMWFPLYFPQIVRALAILLHDITFICFLIGMVWLYAQTHTLLFYDAGAVWDRGEAITPRCSAGVGLRKDGFSVAVAFPIKDGRVEPVLIAGMNF